jgi:hypothetical protein
MSQASLLSPSPPSPGVTPASLKEHILLKIAETCGAQLPCYRADQILDDFISRFTADEVMAICHQALAVHGGMWRGAPVTVLRFQASNDDFFAVPLLEEARLRP